MGGRSCDVKRILAGTVGAALLLASCSRATVETISPSTGPPSTTTTQLTISTAAGTTCQEFIALAPRILERIGGNLELLKAALVAAGEGPISHSRASDVYLMVSERFIDIEEDWRALGPAPPGLESVHDLTLQSISKFLDASTTAAESADDIAFLERANQSIREGGVLFVDATDAFPSFC
jgi:hypothetical protein